MLVGHIGAAAGAKAFDRKLPIWALLITSFLIDLIALPLWVLGVEYVHPMPNADGDWANVPYSYGNLFFKIDYSHALFTAFLLCLIVLIVCARRFGLRGAFILSGVVFSHWFLDLIVHRNDMPIAPGNAGRLPRVGLGMWDFPTASIILELALLIGGVWLWYRAGRTEGDRTNVGPAAITLCVGVIIAVAQLVA